MEAEQGAQGAAEEPQVPAEVSSEEERLQWKNALERVVPACLVLKVTLTRAVDTEPASSAYATGFIVDKTRGIILTNRHVLTPGPIVAEAIFLNREELPVYPLYFDPVHDFGFLRFDPSKLQFMEVAEVPLAPEGVSVGLDIRVVGNDSGEKISILSGTIARLDRDAPVYGRKSYNDFNTFYLQAASGTKGGSSGSPVVDIQGRAVGLNAGGKNKAAVAFYLPLERVVRALRLIQGCKDPGSPPDACWRAPHIPRGDLQTTFTFKGFDEVRRLGLRQETERDVRIAPARCHGSAGSDTGLSTTGMLVVEHVLPGSPADGVLETGDVLVRVNGQVITHFLPLEEVLDECVGQEVVLTIERGGVPVEARLRVTDLHSVTPSSFLELSGGTVHALSYQQARNNRAVVGQVYVAEPGYMLGRSAVPKLAIITALNGVPTPDLPSFARVLRTLPHGARTPLEFFTFHERHRRKNAIMHMDRQWYGPPIYWTRDDAAGTWHPTTDYPPGAPPAPALPSPPRKQQQQLVDGDTQAAVKGASGPDQQQQQQAGASPAAKRGRGGKSAAHANGVSQPAAAPTAATTPAAPVAEQANGASTGAMTDQLEASLRCSLVLVDVDIPLVALSDGVHARSFAGNGVVVYHGERIGLVLVDRNTVTVGPCDVNISFGAHPCEITGTVRFLHPLHNFAVVSYEVSALPPEARSKVVAAQVLPHPPVKRGDSLHLAGLTKFLRIMTRRSTVTTATSAITIPAPEVPRFRAVHEEVIKLDQDFGTTFSGVLTDDRGRIRGLWGSYSEQVEKEEREWCAGLPSDAFWPWVERLKHLDSGPQATPPPSVRTLDAELEPLLLSKAAQFNLPQEWVSQLDKLDPERRQVLRVRSTVANSAASKVLKSGDMLLAVAGRPVTCFRDVESIIAGWCSRGVNGLPADGRGAALQGQVTNDGGETGARAAGEEGGTPTGRGRKRKQVQASSADSPRSSRVDVRRGKAGRRGAGGEGSSIDATAADADGMEVEGSADQDVPHKATDQQQQQDGTGPTEPAAGSAPGAAPVASSSQASGGPGDGGELPDLPVTIFRGGQVVELGVQLGVEDGLGTGRLVHWCGAQLQAPHRAVRELGFLPERAGVYISRWHHGSPAHRYGLYALHWISDVNSRPTPDLDTFLEVVKDLKHGEFVRIKVCHLETTQPKVLTLKVDLIYWPTWELRLHPESCTWERINIAAHSPVQQAT